MVGGAAGGGEGPSLQILAFVKARLQTSQRWKNSSIRSDLQAFASAAVGPDGLVSVWRDFFFFGAIFYRVLQELPVGCCLPESDSIHNVSKKGEGMMETHLIFPKTLFVVHIPKDLFFFFCGGVA